MAEHYREIGLDKGWEWKQVTRLCKLVGITEYDLAALYGIPWGAMIAMRTRNRVPTHIALHFKILLDWWNARYLGIKPGVVIPVDKLAI